MRLSPRIATLVAVSALLAATACGDQTPVTPTGDPPGSPATPAPTAPTTAVTGEVVAPRYLLGIQASPNSFLEEHPVPEAVVMLTDLAGHAIPGLPTAKTDAAGRFTLQGVPAGTPYMIQAAFRPLSGGELRLKGLVKVGATPAAVRLGTASTMLTEALTAYRKGLVVSFDERAYVAGLSAIAAGLTNLNVPDLRVPGEAASAVAAWRSVSPLLHDAMAGLEQDFARHPLGPTPTPKPSATTPRPDSTDTPATPTPTDSAIITITDFAFSPATVYIRQGGTVTFVNADVAAHTATPIDAANFVGTGVIDAGSESVPITFNHPGEHPFACNFYPYMRGKIVVVPVSTPRPTALPTTQPATPTPSPTPTATAVPPQSAGSVATMTSPGALSAPEGIAVDAQGNVYIADTGNNRIRKLTPDGVLSTLAGSGAYGFADGAATSAAFKQPKAVAVDAQGRVYVADLLNRRIRRIDTRLAPTDPNFVTTHAGSGAIGSADGSGATATFRSPVGLAVDTAGNVFVADNENHLIRRIAPDRTVSTVAGVISFGASNVPQPGWQDGLGAVARFAYPSGLAYAAGALYVADNHNNAVRKLTFDAAGNASVATLIGTNPPVTTSLAVIDPAFTLPVGLAVDEEGQLFSSHFNKHRIWRFNGAVAQAYAGSGTAGKADGAIATSTFNAPRGVALAPDGALYVADTNNHVVRRVLP